MKRIFAFMLAAIMLLSLAACGSRKSESERHADKEKPTDHETPHQNKDTIVGDAVIEPQLLCELHGLKISVLGIRYDDYHEAPMFNLKLENTSDTSYTVAIPWGSVNGRVIPAELSAEVAAGETIEADYYFMGQFLAVNQITEIAEIENVFEIRDSELGTEIAISDPVTYRTSLGADYTAPEIPGEVVFQDENIRVYCQGISDWYEPDKAIMFFIENLSDSYLSVGIGDVHRLNGTYELEGIFGNDLAPGKNSATAMIYRKNDFLQEGIDAIESLELSLEYYDYYDWEKTAITEAFLVDFD